MDLSGLIFVALAIAWASYLIPKALRHHDDVVRGRSIDRFSQSMRVLARREPVSSRVARLVVSPARAATSAVVSTKPTAASPDPDEVFAARRLATSLATRRRRRVLTFLLVLLVGVVAVAAAGRLSWTYAAIPAALLVAWLVACRLMVRQERAWTPAVLVESPEPLPADTREPTPAETTSSSPAVTADVPRDPTLWDPVPTTLPTYVSKPAARRSVRTIDLDSTGVWTSGRSESDSALAREAEAAERVRRRTSRKDGPGERAVNS
ncbi:MAG: hypothetical protein QOH37_1382 [Nocardioidaceae bacterium]|nr:hypothetical protein [Nocardioidaceae bacterium]